MFPPAAEVLAGGEGSIAEKPLPLLLQAIFAERRTLTLELRLRGLEKRIQFEDGSPVACRSNLLHETLGKFLVSRWKLTEEEYQDALRASVETGQRMGELLVSRGRIAPFELYKVMQANLAHRILEAFRWSEATYRLAADTEPAELALRVNPAQLVLTGCAGFVPFEVVASQLAFTDEQRFALAAAPPHAVSELRLTTKEAKLVQVLRRKPTFEEAARESGLEVEEAMRRLYALAVLGIVGFAEGAGSDTASASASASGAGVATSTSEGLPPETNELTNALVADYLEHRSRDPFALLALPEAATPADARRAFLSLADRFSPLRFRSADLREKAEALLAARARAFAGLADPDEAALWRKRRAAAAQKAKGARPSTAEQFRISTELLDASAQFAEGRRRLAAGNARGALEQLQYAADIEPTPLVRAHVAWARWLVDPERFARLALGELADVARADPGCAQAHLFAGEIHRARGDLVEAEEAYRRAHRADPADRRAQELALEVLRARKAR
jgi:hypothetical protein